MVTKADKVKIYDRFEAVLGLKNQMLRVNALMELEVLLEGKSEDWRDGFCSWITFTEEYAHRCDIIEAEVIEERRKELLK